MSKRSLTMTVAAVAVVCLVGMGLSGSIASADAQQVLPGGRPARIVSYYTGGQSGTIIPSAEGPHGFIITDIVAVRQDQDGTQSTSVVFQLASGPQLIRFTATGSLSPPRRPTTSNPGSSYQLENSSTTTVGPRPTASICSSADTVSDGAVALRGSAMERTLRLSLGFLLVAIAQADSVSDVKSIRNDGGRLIASFRRVGLANPSGVAVASDYLALYAADTDVNRIYAFGTDGRCSLISAILP